jgi:hypothetical protein
MSSIMRRRSGFISAIGGLLQGWSFDSSKSCRQADRLQPPLIVYPSPEPPSAPSPGSAAAESAQSRRLRKQELPT